MEISRNEPCPCGSGKKYKHCHLGKELPSSVTGETSIDPTGQLETWKVFVGGLAVILLVSIALWVGGFERAGQIFGGVMTLLLIIFSAFRKPPAPRQNPGDASGINFGN